MQWKYQNTTIAQTAGLDYAASQPRHEHVLTQALRHSD